MSTAYIALGSNLGDRRANIEKALAHLKANGVGIEAVSRLVETLPSGGPSQPPFLNGAARIHTDLSPEELLPLLKEAEKAVGRKKAGVRWGPREVDLDLILYGEVVLATDVLTIPHPLFREREFVLDPLAEVVRPGTRDPVTGKTVKDLREELARRIAGRRTARVVAPLAEFAAYVKMAERNRFTIGFVPTMGALHEGHLSLIRAARAVCDKVVVSIFVNPAQFGAGEDLDRYPRPLENDLRLASEAGADILFTPSAAEMYPPGYCTWTTVEGLSTILEGASRPGHFRGVATVVAKLLNLVRPEIAFFGRKDYQQTLVVRRLVADLNLGTEIRVLPTVRDADGLALSSRNAYLSPDERRRALRLVEALRAGKAAYAAGETRGEELTARMRNVLEAERGIAPEYVLVADPETLAPAAQADARSVALVAAKVGKTRLIDNAILGEPE